MYAQDYDERFFHRAASTACGGGALGYQYLCDKDYPAFHWWSLVLPYTRSNALYFCPSSKETTTALYLQAGIRNMAIGFNLRAAPRGIGGTSLAETTRPSNTIMLGEAGYVWNPVATACRSTGSKDCGSPAMSDNIIYESGSDFGPAPRHGDGANIGFVDGHAKWLRPEVFYGKVDGYYAGNKILLNCNGIWFRTNFDQVLAGDPPPGVCGR
jgi:prepilin-type processing-associated H-X9-DG protein